MATRRRRQPAASSPRDSIKTDSRVLNRAWMSWMAFCGGRRVALNLYLKSQPTHPRLSKNKSAATNRAGPSAVTHQKANNRKPTSPLFLSSALHCGTRVVARPVPLAFCCWSSRGEVIESRSSNHRHKCGPPAVGRRLHVNAYTRRLPGGAADDWARLLTATHGGRSGRPARPAQAAGKVGTCSV